MKTNKLQAMRYLSVSCVLLLLVMFVTGCSEEAAPTAALIDSSIENPIALSKNNVLHRVTVGGADSEEFPPGTDANFSLVAIEKANGSVSGQWQDTFGGGGEGIHVAVDCMNVVGNGAVIGGVITNGSSGGDVSGQRALTAVVDNGTSANDPADQISFSFIDDNRDCNNLTPDDFPLFDTNNGQVKVK